ncbi:portal protein [Sphingobium yanoikuyae]|uniref:portal protein n=1 Tax=Sphingobium yanoikuyae TaxID=13690 RepID=UPI0035C71384
MNVVVAAPQVPILAGVANHTFVIGDKGPTGTEAELLDRVTHIVGRLQTLADEQVAAKSNIETRWINNVRAYHGFYDPTTEADLKEQKKSRAYVKLIRAKTTALEARLFDLIFPTDDRNWGIKPTPVPNLMREASQAALAAAQAAEQANQAAAAGDEAGEAAAVAEGNDHASRERAARAIMKQAQDSCDLMQQEMDDQLTECSYPQESRDMIHDACLLGTGILKGPLVNQSTAGQWTDDGNGNYSLSYDENPRPIVRRVDPWSFFPDMSARRIEEAEFTFERYLWTKTQLRKMVKTHGFNPDAVRRILRGERGGVKSRVNLNYLTQIRSITGDSREANISGRFVGWEYHGALECGEVCDLLRMMGRHEEAEEYEKRDDPLEEFRVVAFFCEGELLKISPEYPLDSGETLYSVFNIEEGEGTIFGYGIPHIMADSSHATNAAWRMALDNSALSVGPQVVVDKESIIPADGDWTMRPGKVWLRTKPRAQGDTAKPVEFFDVPNNMNEIGAIIKTSMDFADIETGLPMPQQGEQGAHTTQTFGGMAILQNAANIIFRRIVKNYDDGAITPTMRRLYHWNMQHSQRPEIKGDMSVDARGTSVLLVRELQSQNLMFIVGNFLSNPNTGPMIKGYEVVKKLFQSLMVPPDDVMESKEDYEKAVAAAAEQAAQQPNEAQLRLEVAQVAADARKAASDVSLQIAQLNERTEILRLAQNRELTGAQIQALLAGKKMEIDSSERKMTAEIGAEQMFAREARARGEEPTGSGGYVSAGAEPDKAA